MDTRRFVHAVAVFESAVERPRSTQSERVDSAGALNSDLPAVESVSPEAGGRTVAGLLAGVGAKLTATELEELFGASGVSVVPMYVEGGDAQIDGYYASKDVNLRRPAAERDDLQSFDGQMIRRGSRRSHRRAVRTAPTTVSNPFGSASTEEIAIPARATDVQWFNARGDQSTESATVQRTETGQHDDIDVYDATEPSFSQPALVYDVAYRHGWPVDVRVWDTRENARRETTNTSGDDVGTATIGSAEVGSETSYAAWQRVYRSDHDAVGTLSLENDLLQVALDETRGRLRAARWDESDGQYNRVQLDTSVDWRFESADITHIGLAAVDGQLQFSDGTNTHPLNVSLKRGHTDLVFANPDNAGSVPANLVTRLDAIAADSDQDPGATAGIVEREAIDT